MKWDDEIDNLKRYVFENKMTYSDIGRLYGCAGSTIRKVLISRGIKLPPRKTNEPHHCPNCYKSISPRQKYCSNKCQREYEYKEWLVKYTNDNTTAKNTKWGKISNHLRRYIFEKYNNRCCQCGWSEINRFTNTIPLEVDHIDGNPENNSESNLQLLCPNCHSLTSTYRGANRGYGRNITWKLK